MLKSEPLTLSAQTLAILWAGATVATLVWVDRAAIAQGLTARCAVVPALAAIEQVMDPIVLLAGLGLIDAFALIALTGLLGALARTAAPDVLRIAWPMLKAGLAATLVALVLKIFIGRARPMGDPSNWLTFAPFAADAAFQSAPSAHAALAAALAVEATRRWPRAAILWAALSLLIGAMRVLVGDHWPSDVAAGLGLGAWIGHLRTPDRVRRRRRVWSRRANLSEGRLK